MFRRLAVFFGTFTIEAASTVAVGPDADPAPVFGAIDSLVAKSMVATRQIGASMRYRLLATNRAYAFERSNPAERAEVARRHAAYYRRWLDQTGLDWQKLSTAVERAPHLAALCNVRPALDWCFGPDGDVEMGIGLALAATPVFLAMSLPSDCRGWATRALQALGEPARGGPEELLLQAALLAAEDRRDEARARLMPVFDRFAATADLKNAERLLASLG